MLLVPARQTRTPTDLNAPVFALCNELAKAIQPVFLALRAEHDAIPQECYDNVEQKIRRDGGWTQHGWTIWEWPSVLVEAEFHCVWRSPDGELVDITPKQEGDESILFLPDPKRQYSGKQVDNVRRPVRDDRLIRAFIYRAQELFRITNVGNRARGLSRGEVARIMTLEAEKQAMGMALVQGETDHRPCFCDSGRKFRNCCGKRF